MGLDCMNISQHLVEKKKMKLSVGGVDERQDHEVF